MPRPPHHEPCHHDEMWDEVYLHTPSHNSIDGRDVPDAHPIDSITGLRDKLTELEKNGIDIIDPEIPVAVGNLLVLDDSGNLVDSGRCCSTIPTTEEVALVSRKVEEVETNLGTHTHEQKVASAVWVVRHDAGRYPVVTITDLNRNLIMGEITYIDDNSIQIKFSQPVAGYAYLN